MLGLETEGPVLDRVSGFGGSRKVVPCIELNAGFGCGDFQDPARLGFDNLRRWAKVT